MNLETVEFETAPNPQFAVILLHGLGDSGDGWAPMVPEFVRPEWPAVRFVFPHAPMAPVTINGGMRMRSWYDIVSLDDIDKRADAEGLISSATAVEALIDREAARGVPRSRVVLAGFSQGGAVAMTLALRNADPLAGLVVLSTYLPMSQRLLAEAPEADVLPPVFGAHGSRDPMVPYGAGELAAQQLQGRGHVVEWHSYPMGHEACLEEIHALAAWLTKRFADA